MPVAGNLMKIATISELDVAAVASDAATAIARAKEAAGERDVMVHGVTTTHLALAAGALDEIQIHLVPVLLGGGRHLFEQPLAEQPELELTRVRDGRGVTHVRYRVRR